jgi:hypothetical protein
MVSAFLREAGLDLKKFQALQEQRSAHLERMIAQHKADAVRRAAKQKHTLQSSITAQAKALGDLAAFPDFFPYPSFTLDTPFLIWSIPLQGVLSDSAAVAFGSSAKFKFATSEYSGRQKFGFYFYWVNPSSNYAVINATTFMSATGHLKSHAPWGFFGGGNLSQVEASALLNLWFGWPTDVTSVQGASEVLGGAGALSTILTGGDTDVTSISAGVSLNTTMFAVPPGQIVVFEVALLLEYKNDSGDIEADFESGAFQIACPVVLLWLVGSPPTVLTASPTTVPAGGTVTVTWDSIPTPTALDWIGLYAPGSPNTAHLDFIYVGCFKSPTTPRAAGTDTIPLPVGLAPGSYELRLLANDGITSLASSNPFSILGA